MIYLFVWLLFIINSTFIISLLFKNGSFIQAQIYPVVLFFVFIILLFILYYVSRASYFNLMNRYLKPDGYRIDYKTIDSNQSLHLICSQRIHYTSSKMIGSKNWKMVYGEISKPNLFFDILMVILSILTRTLGSASRFSWIKLFKGDYYLFKFENKFRFKGYLTNFLSKKDFERSIENLPRLTNYSHHNYLIYTNDDALSHLVFNEELVEYINKLNKKISISINREYIHIMVSQTNSLLSYKVLKKLNINDNLKSFKEMTKSVEIIYDSILNALKT